MLIERAITSTLHNFREWFPVVYLGGPQNAAV
jgi:hypothetical protein